MRRPCASSTACFTATSANAQSITFAVDGTDQSGSPVTRDSSCAAAPAPCSKWHFAWSNAGLSDGVYRVTARSVDPNGVQGQPKSILVTISRSSSLSEFAGPRRYMADSAAGIRA